MMHIYKKLLVFISFFLWGANIVAQEDMLSLLDSNQNKTHEKVIATFKDEKIINMQSTETVKAKTMVFNVTHLFGNIGTASGGGEHELYGFDNSADIRIGFDFGITNDLTLGVGRSKQFEMLDGYAKYRILSQTIDNYIPISLAIYSDMSYSTQKNDKFFIGTESDPNFEPNHLYRFSYATQLLIARKFNWRLSAQLTPTFQHRNFVIEKVNPSNGSTQSNDLFSLGGGFRFKLTKRFGIIADYYYTFSDYRKDNSIDSYANPLALGVEIETGGHVFHITFTNASGIIENNYIPYTKDKWLNGGFKFGFNISRVFNIMK